MKSFLPKHLRDLFDKKSDNPPPSRIFAEDVVLHGDLQLAKAQQHQLQRQEENLFLWRSLGQREREVTALVCLGQRNYQIAEAMGIAHGTVKSHLEHIFRKLNMSDRHAVRLAFHDWDFETWWKNRHQVPTPDPAPRIYR
jgi:DNA-binding CsgD family transcriptional regulator